MSESLNSISVWLETHELLVLSVAIPLFSAFIAYFFARYSTRRALAAQRSTLQSQEQMKLADFRLAWIDNLREDAADYVTALATYNEKYSVGQPKLMALQCRIMLRVSEQDEDYHKLLTAMRAALDAAVSNLEESQNFKSDELIELQALFKAILKREWERLKRLN